MNAKIAAAHLTQPHGLKGQLKAKILLENATLLQKGPLETSREGLTLTVTKIQPQPGGTALLTLAESADRTTAESFQGLTLFIARSALPQPSENEVYLHDLLQKQVLSPTGDTLGTVTALRETPGHDHLEITLPGGKTVLVPAHPECFEDLAAPTLTLTGLGHQLATL